MKTYAITGAASGIGAATAKQLGDFGHRVIGVDIRQADVVCDLSEASGRRQAVDEIPLQHRVRGTCRPRDSPTQVPGQKQRPRA